MFDFEKFNVYIKTKEFIGIINPVFESKNINFGAIDQLYRASSSILLNIAEGAGKYSKKDKKRYYTIARGSVHECVAILDLLKLQNKVTDDLFNKSNSLLYEISRMLSGLIRKMDT